MNVRNLGSVVLCVLLSMASARVAPAQEARVDSLFAHLDQPTSPGVAVGVIRDGRVLLRKGYGLANLEHRVSITPTTVFDIASVSKQFAGMAVAMLVEEGRVGLDDDVRDYIPELPDFGHTVTLDHLVHHTSGIRDWPGTLAVAGWRMDDVISFDQILRMAFRQKDLNFVPGDEYTYSNTGYNLLAEVIARVTGRTFREWTDENLFGPLGMEDTHFQDDHTEVVPNRAYGYARGADGGFSATPDLLTALGSSSLFTTIDDLLKWVSNFDTRAVGGPAVMERMRTRGRLNDGSRIAYAFGLNVGEHEGRTTLSHGGSWASFRTYLLHFPQEKLGVVVLANHSPFDPGGAAYRVAEIYLAEEKPGPEAEAAAAGRQEVEAREEAEARAGEHEAAGELEGPGLPVAPEVLDEYIGVYRLGPGWYVEITRAGDTLRAQATAEDRVPMAARSETRFWVDAYGADILFRRDEEGSVTHFVYRGMEAPRLGAPSPPDPRTFQELVGVYTSEELGTSYRVALEAETLVAHHWRHGPIRLVPAWGEDFRSHAWYIRSLAFTRDDDGQVDGFLVNGGERVRNVFFRRVR